MEGHDLKVNGISIDYFDSDVLHNIVKIILRELREREQ